MVVLPNELQNLSNERHFLAKYAIDNRLTMNDYHFARQDLADYTESWIKTYGWGDR